jgi:rubrerythrin
MPTAIFRAAEILDMAIQIERQGIAFYDTCRETIDSSDLKEIFAYLTAQEQVHLRFFSEMKKNSKDFSLPESFPGEYESYLSAFVREKVFSTPDSAAEKARRLTDAHSAVDWALGFERKSIDFYNLIKDKVRASEGAAIERIIREEQRHIARLNELRRKLDE